MPIGGSSIDARLTRLAVQRGVNNKFAHPMVPSIQHVAEDGKYESWDAGLWAGDASAPDAQMGRRQIGGEYQSFDFSISAVSFRMEEFYSYKEFDFREGHFSTGTEVFEKAIGAVNKRHAIARELACKDLFFGTGNWTNTVVGAGDKFDNAASNPSGYIRERWSSIGKSAAGMDGVKTMFMTVDIRDALAQHAQFTKLDPMAEVTGFATHETMAAAMHVAPERLVILEAAYNEQRQGETASYNWIWSDKYIWMGYLPENIDADTQTAAAYIHMGPDTPTVRRGELDNGQKHVRWMRESSIGVYKAVDTAAAELLTGVIT